MKRKSLMLVTMLLFTVNAIASGFGEYEMHLWIKFVGIIMIAWGILEIILFFKIWGMTDDVRKLTDHFCKEMNKSESKSKPQMSEISEFTLTTPDDYEIGEYDHRLDNVKVGDKVRRNSDGKILRVESIGTKVLECKGGMLEGLLAYPKDALSFVDELDA